MYLSLNITIFAAFCEPSLNQWFLPLPPLSQYIHIDMYTRVMSVVKNKKKNNNGNESTKIWIQQKQ